MRIRGEIAKALRHDILVCGHTKFLDRWHTIPRTRYMRLPKEQKLRNRMRTRAGDFVTPPRVSTATVVGFATPATGLNATSERGKNDYSISDAGEVPRCSLSLRAKKMQSSVIWENSKIL